MRCTFTFRRSRHALALALARVLVLVLVLVLVATCFAADARAQPVVLSELLTDVGANSPAIVAATERASAAGLRADASGAWSDPFIAVGPDEYTFGMDPPMIRYQLSQAVPLPGKLGPRVDAARAQTRLAEASVDIARRQLRVTVIELFVRALYVDRALAANASLQQTLADVIASAEARYVTGGASAHHDVLIATAERATLERDALALARQRAVLLGQLDELAGRPPGDPERALVDDRADDAPVPASFEDAVQAQPELAAAAVGVDAAEARRRAAGVAALPDLVVQGMAMQSLMPDEPSNVGAMIGVSVPLFYPWKQGAIADAAARDKAAWETERRQLELRLRAEWNEASTRLRTAEDTLALYDDKIVPTTAAALASSQAAYAAQSAPLFELLGVIRASTTVELERAAAELDVRLARLRLTSLLSMGSSTSLAPASPTLFSAGGMRGGMGGTGMGAMGGAMGSMGTGGMDAQRPPVRMGNGMTPPTLDTGDGEAGADGMTGMGGM